MVSRVGAGTLEEDQGDGKGCGEPAPRAEQQMGLFHVPP